MNNYLGAVPLLPPFQLRPAPAVEVPPRSPPSESEGQHNTADFERHAGEPGPTSTPKATMGAYHSEWALQRDSSPSSVLPGTPETREPSGYSKVRRLRRFCRRLPP
ncbi:hypothetical protein DIPPA_63011 [Diplonema papillatum]|nr:hypothetical protein DIPPA_63011 [Diplonema papillatum]